MSTSLPTIDEAEFRAVIDARAGSLLGAAALLAEVGAADVGTAMSVLCRPLLSEMLSQAIQLEELLDAYGALRNERWRPFRNRVAAMKLFARVHYSLVHLAHGVPHYQCVPVEGDLGQALADGRRSTARVLQVVSRRLLEAAAQLGLTPGQVNVCEERLPAGVLPQDRPLRHVADVAGTLARLATAFLNLAEEAGGLSRPPPDLPEEAELRRLSEDFHNLQALYDTHVAHTDVERDDPQIRALRGHASVVFHLLEIATELTHFHERHVKHAAPAPENGLLTAPFGLSPDDLERVLSGCALVYAARYVAAGRSFAQQLLRRYAEQGEITVPVPRYRGFHVRPSTLVARVTYHYGSPVTMRLDEETYDAASPLDLFRANEKINARKRKWLAREIVRIMEGAGDWLRDGVAGAIRDVVMRLADEAKVVVYEHPLQPVEAGCQPCLPCEGQPLISFVVDAVARLQALGKLDIVDAVHAVFRGDRRVLADIEKLASAGYGEDAYGNNVALPEELRYLRR